MITDGHLLGGRVIYRQTATGFRSGIEPVLLAAAVPAKAGEHLLEAGTGAGAALLCLSARVAGVQAIGVEIDPEMADLAAANAYANGFHGIEIITDRIEAATFHRLFDHAIMNPPYHPVAGTNSPDAKREKAKRGPDGLIPTWIGRLSRALRDRGTLTVIVPAGVTSICLTAMAQCRCPCTILFPLWPKAGRAAKLVLLRGVKHARMPMRLSSGLILHNHDGSYTAETHAILAAGAALALETDTDA